MAPSEEMEGNQKDTKEARAFDCCRTYEGEEHEDTGHFVPTAVSEAAENAGLSSVVETVEEGIEKLEEAVEGVGKTVETAKASAKEYWRDTVETVKDWAEETFGPMFNESLENSVDKSLNYMSPKVGNTVVDKAIEKYPGIKRVDDKIQQVSLRDHAVAKAQNAIMSLRDEIINFCRDVFDLLLQGLEVVRAGVSTIRKVLVKIMQALWAGCEGAVQGVKEMLPDCCECCLGMFFDVAALVRDCYEALVQVIRNEFEMQCKHQGVPQMILDKVNWNVDRHEDVGQPLCKSGNQVAAPAQNQM